MKKLLALIFTAFSLANTAHADFYRYTFNGVLPDGSSAHLLVQDGESWTASFIIDSTAADTNPDPSFGVFEGAVVSGSLEFSGGYVANSTTFAGGTAFALDDVFSADSVRVRGESGVSDFIFQASSEDLSNLNSDLLPTPGTSILPFPDPATFEYFQLTFDDEFGSISYFANIANNTSFTASSIPEPNLGVLVATVLAISFSSRRRTNVLKIR